MKTIYLDVLIVLNIYVNFFLLKATAKFTHTLLKTSRCIFASVTGSLFSLTIILPSGSFLLSLIIKLTAAAVITFTAFGKRDIRGFLRLLLYFYIINFIFAGAVLLLYMIFKPSFMAFNNSYFYVDFSLLSLVVFTAAAYGVIYLMRCFMDKKTDCSKKYRVSVTYRGKTVTLDGIADTGNNLTDVFTGRPVVICPQSAFGFESLPLKEPELLYSEYGFRLIPYSTISESGLIPVFEPQSLIITETESGISQSKDVLVGLAGRDTKIIFDPKILL